MWILIVILIGVALFGLVAGYFYNRNIQKKIDRGELEEAPPVVTVDSECCGQHQIWRKRKSAGSCKQANRILRRRRTGPLQGRPSDGYSEEEIEEFRDILYSMQEVDVAGWSRSLQLRGIELPDELKDELFLIVGERRFINLPAGLSHYRIQLSWIY